MKTFNFFLITAGLLSSGIITLVKDDYYWLACPLGFILMFLCVLFWRLDQRNRMLISNGENALKFLDASNRDLISGTKPHVLCIFETDDFITKGKSRSLFRNGHFSYSQVIAYVYLMFALLGLIFTLFPAILEVVEFGFTRW